MDTRKHTSPPPPPAPHRGEFGAPRPAPYAGLLLPPHRMPRVIAGRPLKAWRFVAFFSPELVLCAATVRIGPAPDAFWAVWDRVAGRFWHGSGRRAGRVRCAAGRTAVRARGVAVALSHGEEPGVEAIAPTGRGYAWTRKQAGVEAVAAARTPAGERRVAGAAVIDDTAAYYDRHTRWRWAAGVGRSDAGAALAFNLVSGVNDAASGSERTLWVDGAARELPPCRFAADLSAVDGLRFRPEAALARRINLGVLRSSYRLQFGTFAGRLPGELHLVEGLGVMEDHDAWW